MAMTSCNYEPVKLYYFLFEVIRQMLSKCGLRLQCDGMVPFPTDIRAYGCFEFRLIAKFCRL